MQPFTTHRGLAAPLKQFNTDTDQIVPARFLLRARKDGFSDALFADLRDEPNFVLNDEPAKSATILIAGGNFGCGSSREHAVWSLADYGFRVVIAPSFADIFFNNALQNGLLAIPVADETVERLWKILDDYPEAEIAVDLSEQTVTCSDLTFAFEISPYRKEALLQGLSETARTLQSLDEIESFERVRARARPWLAAPYKDERIPS